MKKVMNAAVPAGALMRSVAVLTVLMRSVAVLTVLMLSVPVLTGCGGTEKNYEVDVQALGSELLEKAEFEDELNPAADKVIQKLYGMENYAEACVYIGTGATPEEIAVFRFETGEDAAEGLRKAQERVEEQKTDYESYLPGEVKKLQDAVVRRYGQYVVVCVSDGETAERVLDTYFAE